MEASSKTYQALILATILIGGIVFLWGLGDIPLLSYNEARRAIPAANMFYTSDWLFPRLNGELYLSKPPLIYWLAAEVSWLFGTVNEWTLRLPSAMAASTIVIVTYRYMRTHFGAWPALFAVQLLIANVSFAMFARRAEIEMLLTALCFFSFMSAMKYTSGEGGIKWLRLSYFLLGGAVLAKGPLAMIFVTLPLLAEAVIRRQSRYWKALGDPLSWLIFIAVGASWYLNVSWFLGLEVWGNTVNKDMLNKVHGASGEPFLSYLTWILVDFLPFSLLLTVAPIVTLRRWKSHDEAISIFIAIAVPFLVYTAFSDKHSKYLLPIYPFIAILLGKRLGELFESSSRAIRRSILAAALALPIGYAVYYATFEAFIFSYRYEALPRFSAWINSQSKHPIYAYHRLDERLIFYAHRHIPILGEESFAALRTDGALLLVEHSGITQVQPKADCIVREFKPYLKKDKSLVVFGFGSACS
jgi:4-amino-4-deoxy-L-arabinose transferase-like glycosyltransferase